MAFIKRHLLGHYNTLVLIARVNERPVGVWIEKFGAMEGGGSSSSAVTTTTSEEESGTSDPLAFYRKNPELLKRYFPHLAAGMPSTPTEETATTTETKQVSTNALVIDIRCRALNLEKTAGSSGLNNQLAYDVVEAFKKTGRFDTNGTKLAEDVGVEKVEATADTFTFGLKLALKNGLQSL